MQDVENNCDKSKASESIKALLSTPNSDLTALAQLVAIHMANGVTDAKQLASLTGYSERAIRKAKTELECRSQGATEPGCRNYSAARNQGAGTRVPNGTPVPESAFARVEEKLLPPKQEEISQHLEQNSKPAKPAASCKRGSRLPDDWVLPKSWGDWTLTTFPASTPELVRLEAEKFADHWHSAPGQKGVKLDWLATWRNWCRNSKTFTTAPTRQGFGQTYRQPANVVPIRDPSVVRHAKPAAGSVMMELANA